MLTFLVNAFPVWALLASLLALWRPGLFTWFSGPLLTTGLAVIMLGMGLTLEASDFLRVARQKTRVLLGVALQYTLMPATGWFVARSFDLPAPFAIGLLLVACCPGGTASNVVAYIARADVPLSVAMTAGSTLLAALATPALTALVAGSRVDVPVAGLFTSTVQVVVLPIAVGLAMRRQLPRLTRAILPAAPLIAVAAITLIVASIIGAGREAILAAGLRLLLAVALLHSAGFAAGYAAAWAVTRDAAAARTISIEVGMQNSGLGVVLARQNFANPLVAIPSAISSLFHSLIASILAAIWRRSSVDRQNASLPRCSDRGPQSHDRGSTA